MSFVEKVLNLCKIEDRVSLDFRLWLQLGLRILLSEIFFPGL